MKTIWNRRGFLKKSALSSMASIIGTNLAFAEKLPKNYLPIIFKEGIPGKDPEMIILNEKPWNAEAPPHLLADDFTPADKFFVRNNGLVPENINRETWILEISGESAQNTKTYTINDLKQKFKNYSYYLTLECGGNGRSEFVPSASGNQWNQGAVACSKWTGVRLKDVLQDVGIKSDAVYIGYYGADIHLSGDPEKSPISRGVPIEKALQDETLIAWSLNDEDIPMINGFPLRLVCGGWPASTSGKWLKKIVIRNQIHDGPKMTGDSYKVPKYPVEPGEKVPEEDFKIIESMPVKSLITSPKSGAMFSVDKSLNVSGHAWAGENKVKSVQVSIDYGATWLDTNLNEPINRLAWQNWAVSIQFPSHGYFEIWAKATDDNGVSQPMVIPGWNPKGYLNNSCHRIAVKVS